MFKRVLIASASLCSFGSNKSSSTSDSSFSVSSACPWKKRFIVCCFFDRIAHIFGSFDACDSSWSRKFLRFLFHYNHHHHRLLSCRRLLCLLLHNLPLLKLPLLLLAPLRDLNEYLYSYSGEIIWFY